MRPSGAKSFVAVYRTGGRNTPLRKITIGTFGKLTVEQARVAAAIRHGRLRDLAKVDYGNRGACRDCPMRARCTNDVRSVSRLENEAVLDRMAERLTKRPEILDRRREVVEHPFGSIKQWMYQGAFLMRGLANVRAEFSLTALAYNLRRALNILGVEAMTAAVVA